MITNNNIIVQANSALKVDVLNVIIAGGGTGGHIFPAVAIANAMRQLQPNIRFLFVGANGKMEMEKVPQAGFDIKGIDIAGFNRTALLKNIGLPFKIIKSFFQVKKIMTEFKPSAVIGVGGYSTFPVLRYAQAKGIPTFIHESNSYAGKANMLLGKKATKVYVATTGMEQFFPANKIMITGNPVRKVIAENKIDKDKAVAFFELAPHKKTILSIGGSLGAKSINEAIATSIDLFKQNDIQLIWQTGKGFTAKEFTTTMPNVYTSEFIKEMDYAFAAADIVISRAGAIAIAELCTVGKPAILVPYPYAAEDHQTVNAQYLVAQNAAIMIKDGDVKKELANVLNELLGNDSKKEAMAAAIKKLAVVDADAIVAKDILNELNRVRSNA